MVLRILFFFIFAFFSNAHQNNNCFQYDSSKLEFLCPINYSETGGFEMVVTPMKEVIIECDHLVSFKTNHLPNITISRINLLQFRFCPLPENGLKEILDWFSTEDVAVIQYDYSTPKNKILEKRFFDGLQRLRYLKLSKNKFGDMEEDVFSNLPNLIALDLKQNDLLVIKENFFAKLQHLEWLDLSDNLLKTLPKKWFQSLTKLEFLNLWGNRINALNDSTFEGLISLKYLDLSGNKIAKISNNAFENLKNLVNLSLAMNELTSIPFELLRKNNKLQSILLNDNPNFELVDYLFSNFSLLQEVDLSKCNLQDIPPHIFENSRELKIITLRKNRLTKLSKNLFKNLNYLEELDLSGNQLEDVTSIFTSLKNLKILHLQNNFIKKIEKDTFSDLFRLKELNLAQNQIKYIHPRALYNNDRLKVINLSKNLYSGEDSILKDLIYLQEVNLSHNFITQIEQVITFDNKPLMEIVDLRQNRITNISLGSLQGVSELEVFLEFNNITKVDFRNVDLISGPHTSIIHLGHNPIRCDCHNYDLLKYFTGKVSPHVISMFNIRKEGLICGAPSALKNTDLGTLPLRALICPLEDLTKGPSGCPSECSCTWRPFDTSVIIDCANKNLTRLPNVAVKNLEWMNFTNIELNLNNNSLREVNLSNFENITQVFLSNNKLMEIYGAPKHLKVLKLNDNHLSMLSAEVLQVLSSSMLTNLTLENNPWICTCGSEIIGSFLRQHTKQVDSKHIYCANSTLRLIDLHKKDLCQDFALVFTILIALFLLVLVTCLVLYYRYHQTIKVWLFSKNLCLWWVTEEDLDKNKAFDAFICYSHKDESFVVGTLISTLENGPEGYKLCVHIRNWCPGELISTNIINSVVASRRTIIVLSNNFLESVWGKAEFQRAHAEAMSEGKARVIILVYGDVDLTKIVDNELQCYLKTNTYIKWGEPYFWEKLKYALPHHRKNVNLEI